jgi:hypothetical protein
MSEAEQKIEEILTKVADNKRPKVEVTQEEKEDYYKAFRLDTPYSATTTLFGGRMKVVFRGLFIKEQEAIFEQVSKDEVAGVNTTSPSYINRIQFFRLVSSLVSIDGVKPFDEHLTLTERVDKLQDLPVMKVFALNQAFVRFEEKVEALTIAISDENF